MTLMLTKPLVQSAAMGVVWKKHPQNRHFIVGLKGTQAYKPFGRWNTREYLDNTTQRVCKRLLEVGGKYVLWPEEDFDEEEYVSKGEFFSAENCKFAQGRPSDCHRNSANIWYKSEPGTYTIATGYALSEDGLWRQHSFLINADGTVTETTVPRVQYFGYKLTPVESIMMFLGL